MTLTELRTKYATGTHGLRDAVIANSPGRQTIQIEMDEHRAPMGDFLRDYVLHLQKPWWRRWWDWSIVEKHMRDQLNAQCVEWWDR